MSPVGTSTALRKGPGKLLPRNEVGKKCLVATLLQFCRHWAWLKEFVSSPWYDIAAASWERYFRGGGRLEKFFYVRTKPTNPHILHFGKCRLDCRQPLLLQCASLGCQLYPECAECRFQKTNSSPAEVCVWDATILWQIANCLLLPAGCLRRNQRKDKGFIFSWWKECLRWGIK